MVVGYLAVVALVLLASVLGWRRRQRRLAREKALSTSEAKYRLLLEAAPCAIVISSLADSKILYLNQRAISQFAVTTAADVLGTPAAFYYQNPADREHVIGELKRNGQIDDVELALRTPAGQPLWMSITARLTEFEGKPAAFFAAVDVSSRHRMEIELREQRRVLQQFYDAMIDHVFLLQVEAGPSFRLVACNNAMASFFGQNKEQMISHTLAELLPDPDMRARIQQRYEDVIVSRQPAHYEESAPDRDNVVQEFDTLLTPLLDEHGNCQYICGISRLISDRKQMERALRLTNEHLQEQLQKVENLHGLLREQAMRDPLTNLYNRRYLEESLNRELARAEREHYAVSVVMLDIDHFKKLNDNYGHPAGDEVLRQLAKLLQEQARISDIPCRFGGEEFLLVLPHTGLPVAQARAEQIRLAFATLVIEFAGQRLGATVSAGVACSDPHGSRADQLIKQTDTALYAAKHAGRNRVEVASS